MRVLAALVTTLTLPFGGIQWWTVQPAGQSVLVTGSPPNGALCEYLVVHQGTFVQRGPLERPCTRPPVRLHPITPVVGSARDMFHVPVSVAGKVVMRFEYASDTHPQFAWYRRSLWIYDMATTEGAEALRFDASTGRLLQKTAMPPVERPVMVANGDGLWLDPATNGGISGVDVAPVLHVPFGASRPVVVHRGGRAALWMVASAHTVWFEQIAGFKDVSIWRIDGTKVRLLSRPRKIGIWAAYGGGKLWELQCSAKDHLLLVDQATGALTPVGQFEKTTYCDAAMTVAGDNVYVLEGQKLYVYG